METSCSGDFDNHLDQPDPIQEVSPPVFSPIMSPDNPSNPRDHTIPEVHHPVSLSDDWLNLWEQLSPSARALLETNDLSSHHDSLNPGEQSALPTTTPLEDYFPTSPSRDLLQPSFWEQPASSTILYPETISPTEPLHGWSQLSFSEWQTSSSTIDPAQLPAAIDTPLFNDSFYDWLQLCPGEQSSSPLENYIPQVTPPPKFISPNPPNELYSLGQGDKPTSTAYRSKSLISSRRGSTKALSHWHQLGAKEQSVFAKASRDSKRAFKMNTLHLIDDESNSQINSKPKSDLVKATFWSTTREFPQKRGVFLLVKDISTGSAGEDCGEVKYTTSGPVEGRLVSRDRSFRSTVGLFRPVEGLSRMLDGRSRKVVGLFQPSDDSVMAPVSVSPVVKGASEAKNGSSFTGDWSF